MKNIAAILIVIVQAALATAQDTQPPSAEQRQPRVSICRFEYSGPGGGLSLFLGLAGFVADAAIAVHQAPQIVVVARDVHKTFEDALASSDRFRYIRNDQLITKKDGRSLSLREAAAANQLAACIDVFSAGGAGFGWNKKAVATTKWNIVGLEEWRQMITTNVASPETHGKFPDPADPNLHPVYVELAKQSVNAFFEKYDELLQDPKFSQRLQQSAAVAAAAEVPPQPPAAKAGAAFADAQGPAPAPAAPEVVEAPASRPERTVLAVGKPITIDSFRGIVNDTTTNVSGTSDKGVYLVQGDVVLVDRMVFLWMSETIRIAPNAIVPTASPVVRGQSVEIIPKMRYDEPRTVKMSLDSPSYIASGPNGCTLKRRMNELLLLEGEAVLLTRYPE